MAVNLSIPDLCDIHPVAGVVIGVTEANIRKPNRRDLTVFSFAPDTTVAGVFTKNRFCAAPVQVCREHLNATQGKIRALVINTGNANAGTGAAGLAAAQATCVETAKYLQLKPEQVLPFSTGVILEPLPLERVLAGIPHAIAAQAADQLLSAQSLSAQWLSAAYAIMTTDTLPKVASRQVQIDGHSITLTGISKGAGMIRPNMATMLGFMVCDVGVAPEVLNPLVIEVANQSFNRITVDGDTSTNDSFIIAATGQSGLFINSLSDPRLPILKQALCELARELAQKIIRDAEGATKLMTIQVQAAQTSQEALLVAYAVAQSPLVKTAFYASDPNLGRILAAIGYAGIEDLDVSTVDLWLDDVWVAQRGERHPDYQEAQGQRVMQQSEILVRIALGRGTFTETVYTCDFSHEYVSINADYRS